MDLPMSNIHTWIELGLTLLAIIMMYHSVILGKRIDTANKRIDLLNTRFKLLFNANYGYTIIKPICVCGVQGCPNEKGDLCDMAAQRQ